ncbi:MAG: hypothetical protein JST42_15780, partial [Bacteroidetes bacterium]|nr:hypothetical protein [Bacteroidota bacterium]
ETGCEVLYTYCIVYLIFPRYIVFPLHRGKKEWLTFGSLFAGLSIAVVVALIVTDSLFHPSSPDPAFSFLSFWGAFWSTTGYGAPAVCMLFLVIRSLKVYN